MNDPRRSLPAARRTSARYRNGRYRTRMMGAVIVSLLIVLGLTRMPLSGGPERVGWGPGARADEPIRLRPTPPERSDRPKTVTSASAPMEGAPITGVATGEPADRKLRETRRAAAAPAADEEPHASEQREQPLSAALLAVDAAGLQSKNRLPKIKGGLGNLYLKIDYPVAARTKGVEGRLVLQFVVERDGRTSHIRVTQPLHPLLDSSAVAALEQTRFVPGHWRGRPVRVRMKLPVRFRLIGVPTVKTDARTAEVH